MIVCLYHVIIKWVRHEVLCARIPLCFVNTEGNLDTRSTSPLHFWCCDQVNHTIYCHNLRYIFGALSLRRRIMTELKRAQSSRRGYRTHLKKLLQSAEELLATPLVSKINVASLRDLHEQLQRKQE